MVKRGVMFTCKQIRIDEEVRYVFLHCIIENREYVLANIYIPLPFKLEVMYKLMDFMMDKTGIPVIAMGDFNEVINKLDRFPGDRAQNASESRLYQFLQEAGLFDIWRIRNPEVLQYSCCSSSYSTLWARFR